MKKKRRSGRTLTKEERSEKRAVDRALVASSIQTLRSNEGWQRWLRVRRHFHSYSLANQFLIASQRPDATRVAGFKSWLDLGYAVRKGERGLATCTRRPALAPASSREWAMLLPSPT